MTTYNVKTKRWETYLCKDCGENHQNVNEAWACDIKLGLRLTNYNTGEML